MLVNLVHHQIAIEYVPSSSQIVSVIYKEVYSKRNEVAPDRISDRTLAKSLLQYNPSSNFEKEFKKIIVWVQNKNKKETNKS